MTIRHPETVRTPAGRTLRIREMSNDTLAHLYEELRSGGYVSYREWMQAMPTRPNGIGPDGAAMIPEASGLMTPFDAAWSNWCKTLHHVAIDAINAELAYRRRHRVEIAEDPPLQQAAAA